MRLHQVSFLALGLPAPGVRPHHDPAELAVGALQPALPAVCEGWWGTAWLALLCSADCVQGNISLLFPLDVNQMRVWMHTVCVTLGDTHVCPPRFVGECFLLPKHSVEYIWALTQFQKRHPVMASKLENVKNILDLTLNSCFLLLISLLHWKVLDCLCPPLFEDYPEHKQVGVFTIIFVQGTG